MEILEILKNSRDELYLEDLLFFETELATGEYEESYVAKCKEQIEIVRRWLSGKDDPPAPQAGELTEIAEQQKGSLIMGIHDVAPKTANPIVAAMSPEDIILMEIQSMRERDSYKNEFKKYVREKPEIDGVFVDTHYSFFLQWEMDAIVSVIQLGEVFLEKYFGALDKEKIARYQAFSESFFMKHYAQMDATIVLMKGKNEWRKKENRSKQLDVFLRLKGVKL